MFKFAARNSNSRNPFVGLLMPEHAFISGTSFSSLPLIVSIRERRAFSEIFFSIVKLVMIAMVHAFESHNFLMHVHMTSFFGPRSSESSSMRIPHRKPNPLTEPFKIFEIDNGNLALRQRDKTVEFIEWLGKSGALFSGKRCAWHKSSEKGFLLPSHFTIQAR